MKHLVKLGYGVGCIMFISGCLPQGGSELITVDGSATIEVMPDTFEVNGQIFENGEDKDAVLVKIADLNTQMLSGLNGAKNLSDVNISTRSVNIAPLRDGDCLRITRYTDEEQCPISSYSAYIAYTMSGSPAEEAGNVVSLMTTLGADSASIESYSLKNKVDAQARAQTAAVENARAKARMLAAGFNARLGKISRLDSGPGFQERQRFDRRSVDATDAIVMYDRAAPNVPVNPELIEFSDKVTVAFEIIQDTE